MIPFPKKELVATGLVTSTFLFSSATYSMNISRNSGSLQSKRPVFTTTMSVENFRKHYWYAEELRKICKQYNISHEGTKAELQTRIERLLLGERASSVKQSCSLKSTMTDRELGLLISPNDFDYQKLSVRVLGGFKFSPNWRDFCGRILGEKNFKFTKQMAAAVREIKRKKDESFTVRDLLVIYKTGKIGKETGQDLPSYMKPEEETYQWNNFVRDFNSDSRSKDYNDKMKVAALLWSKVRDNPGSKKYSTNLIDIYQSEIEIYRLKK